MCWSGGKDSALALHEVLRDPTLRVAALLVTITEEHDRISMHGVRRELVARQAEALGLPLADVSIPPECSEADYARAMQRALASYQAGGVSRCVFGDVFLEDVRAYREERLAQAAMSAVFPLWGRDTTELAREFVEQGFRATLTCVDPNQLDPAFCGREYDARLLQDLPSSVDPCGENGEFHTFVYDGPMFSRPVATQRGVVVERSGFWFCDLIPA